MTDDRSDANSGTDTPDESAASAGHREPTAPARVMSVHAHPDDQEFSVAGTLAKWVKAGSQVVTVCITSGGAGSNEYTPPTMTRAALVPIREEEQRNACRVLGISEVVFMGYEDGLLEPTIGLRRDLTRLVRRYRPDAVICSDPTVRYYGNRYMNHPDHRAGSSATLDAVFPSAATRFIFPELLDEGLEPHHVSQVFIFGATHADTFIDVAEYLPIKLAALREHKTQLGTWDPTEMVTGWAREQGLRRKLAAAETYRCMILSEDAEC